MRKFLARQKGFTLVEILIAVGILAIITAVAIPTVAKFTGNSKTKSAAAELTNVQTAVDSMMADLGIETVTVILQANAINAMGSFPDVTNPLNGNTTTGDYLRSTNTKHNYYIAATGAVSQIIVP